MLLLLLLLLLASPSRIRLEQNIITTSPATTTSTFQVAIQLRFFFSYHWLKEIFVPKFQILGVDCGEFGVQIAVGGKELDWCNTFLVAPLVQVAPWMGDGALGRVGGASSAPRSHQDRLDRQGCFQEKLPASRWSLACDALFPPPPTYPIPPIAISWR